MLACAFVGSRETVRRGLQAFIEETGADELIVASAIYDHAARLRSYEILAEVRNDAGPGGRADLTFPASRRSHVVPFPSDRHSMTLAASSTPHDGLENPQRVFVFLTMAVVITMAVLDGAIVNVALPTISRDLGVSPANAVWIVNSYQARGHRRAAAARRARRQLGYRRVYWGGLAHVYCVVAGLRLVDGLSDADARAHDARVRRRRRD